MKHQLNEKLKKVYFDSRKLAETPNFLSTLMKMLLVIAFLAIVYFQDLGQIFSLSLANAEVQYILIVPIVSAFFFFKKRKAFFFYRKNTMMQDLAGASGCLLALLIYTYGSYSLFPIELHLLTLPLFAGGIILLLFGIDTLKTLIFPIALLFFLSPFPIFFSDTYGGYFIDSTATLSASFLKIFIPIEFSLRPTAIISTLTSTGQIVSFEIAPACSGIYSLISMSFFATVFLYIVSGSWIKKALFAALSLVTVFLLNTLRVVLTVILGYSFGYGIAAEFFHNFGGLVILFLGSLFLIFAGDKFLKLSFLKDKTPQCNHENQNSNVCYKCGRIFKMLKNPLNLKHLSIVCLFLLILSALFLQASAVAFNKASNDKNNFIDLNPNTGSTTTFIGLQGWSSGFVTREHDAEERLGLFYVGDYVLRSENYTMMNAILEVSDAQSKFHTWEGCLNYQNTPMQILKKNVLTLYDENNTIVTAETMVADIPAYSEKLILIYWFDAANLRINGTTATWALKMTIYETVDDSNNSTEADMTELIQLGKDLETSWSQYKSPAVGFSADIYRNITAIFSIVAGTLIASVVVLQSQSLLTRKQLSKKAKDLTLIEHTQLDAFSDKKKNAANNVSQSTDAFESERMIKQLEQEGFLKEKYILKNSQPYIKWKKQTE